MTDTALGFLRWLHDDQAGYAEIVAGAANTEKPDKIDLVMRTRRFLYLDPERPDLYDQAGAYIAQLSASYGNVYTGVRLYTRQAKDENTRAEAYTKPGRVIFVDDAPPSPELPYSASVRTSESSRHAYYKCAESVTKDDARRAAAALGGDPSGVDLTQLVRFPGTFNTKNNGRWSVELEVTTGPLYNVADLRQRWPAIASRLGTTGAAWGDAYTPAEWENLPDGGPLWHSPYIAAAAGQRRPDLEKLLRGERVTVIKKDDTRDDSDSAQIAALAYNLLSADVCKPQARAIADYLYTHLRPGKTREHYRAHFDAELERYTPKHYRPKEIRYTGAPRQVEPLPPAEHKPEPKSRARNDRPQHVAGAAGYLGWLRTQADAQSGSVMLSQSQCADRLGCCVRTIKRYEKALGTQIERRVFARRQAGCLFILAPDVVPTSLADVVIADVETAQQSAENVQPATMQVEHTAPPVTSPRPRRGALVAEAFDALDGCKRLTDKRIRQYIEMNYPEMTISPATLHQLATNERTKRRYAKQDAREMRKARALFGKALSNKSRAIAGAAAQMHRTGDKRAPIWDRRAGIYAQVEAERQQAEQERIARIGYSLTEQAEMLDLVDQVRIELARRKIGRAAAGAACVPPNLAPAGAAPSGLVERLHVLKAQRSAGPSVGLIV
jgi:hypothetical protein